MNVTQNVPRWLIWCWCRMRTSLLRPSHHLSWSHILTSSQCSVISSVPTWLKILTFHSMGNFSVVLDPRAVWSASLLLGTLKCCPNSRSCHSSTEDDVHLYSSMLIHYKYKIKLYKCNPSMRLKNIIQKLIK